MQVAITGASGFVGQALAASLRSDGHVVRPLVRSRLYQADHPETVFWDPAEGVLDPDDLTEVDAVVHLAGAGIGDRRWSERRKREIRDSRVRGTDLLARKLAELSTPPKVMVSASAVGYYGDRDDTVLTETAEPGEGFLADLVTDWEAAAAPAREAGIRVVLARSGIVLDRSGGALRRLLLPFRLGLGGRLGPGTQWMSWISLTDEVRALRFLLDEPVSGPANLTAPGPVTNRDFTRALGRAVRRPTPIPTPVFGLRLVMGSELVDEMLLAGQRCRPEVLEAAGFAFAHPDIETGLSAALAT